MKSRLLKFLTETQVKKYMGKLINLNNKNNWLQQNNFVFNKENKRNEVC